MNGTLRWRPRLYHSTRRLYRRRLQPLRLERLQPRRLGARSNPIRAGLSRGTEQTRGRRHPSSSMRALSVEGTIKEPLVERDVVRLGLPSKGRMAEDTLALLKDCQLSVYKPNPRQYVATIPQIPGIEAWFQRASDVVRKLKYGDIDLGIVGYDMFCELADDDNDLVLIHDALKFGKCHLSLGVPISGMFTSVFTIEDLKGMEIWSSDRPMRVATGYANLARDFFARMGFEHVSLLGGDGALEAAPAMGSADLILDLVSTGVTLRENNLREIEGGKVLESQGVLVGHRRSLLERPGLLTMVRELLDRLDAHLKAEQYFSVVANMRGADPSAIAAKLKNVEGLSGLEGPTLSPVYSAHDGVDVYAACICVKKSDLYIAVKSLRKLGGSGVLVQPMTYVFDEESDRWQQLLETLNLTAEEARALG